VIETSPELAFGPSTLKLSIRISESGCDFQPSGLVHCTGLSVVDGGAKLPVAPCIATLMPSFGILQTSTLSLLHEQSVRAAATLVDTVRRHWLRKRGRKLESTNIVGSIRETRQALFLD
jgi:hypothetical protein